MPSIFNNEDNEEIINRLNNLTPETKPLWGKMNVGQMLSHCQAPIDLAFGTTTLKANFLMQLIGKRFKNKILNSPEFKKNSPTAPSFIRTQECNFEENKKQLIQKISQFASLGPKAIHNYKHPFFGEMSIAEWDKLQTMHIDHHLKQFGV